MTEPFEHNPPRVTQAEIARIARVSRATASLALRDSPHISLETFGRVILRRINELIDNPDDFPLTIMLSLVLEDNGTCGPA
ncbi:MAG: hypothetical protein ACKJSG_03895 [Lentisphaeria bacterium]